MAKVPGVKRQAQKAATKAKILDVATGLFKRHGYQNVTLRHVAEIAGFSTGAIVNGFGGKDGLFTACMGRPVPDVMAFLKELEASWPIGHVDPHRKLHGFTERAGDLLRDLEGTPE